MIWLDVPFLLIYAGYCNVQILLLTYQLSLSGTVKLEVRVDGKRTPAALQEWAGQGGGCLQPAI